MSQTARAVARQASLLMLASTAQKAIAFFAFTIAARVLGVDGVGTYFYVLSLSSLAGAWTDLGMTPIVIRAFAASEEAGWQAVRRAVVAKAVLVPLAAISALLYTRALLPNGGAIVPLVVLALVVMAEDAFSLLGYGILRGRQRLERESLGMVLGQLLSSGALVAAVLLGFGVTGALLALLLGSAWHLGWSAFWVWRFGIGGWTGDSLSWRSLAREAVPFALAGLFVRIYSSVDALLLRQWQGEAVVGHYAVAYKLTYALQFLPLAFVAALYPALSAAHAREDEAALVHTSLGSWRFMAFLGFPLAAALSGFAPRLVTWVYGTAFTPAAPILSVLAWALPLLFLDFPVGSYLNATHQAGRKTLAMGVTMGVNAVANVLLIPVLGGVGAALAALLGYVALLGVGVWYARSVFFSATARQVMYRGVVLSAVLWSVIHWLLAPVPLIVALLVAPLIALALALGLSLVRVDDLRSAYTWGRRSL